MSDSIDLGSGHSFTWAYGVKDRVLYGVLDQFPELWPERSYDLNGEHIVLIGIVETHARANGQPCSEYVPFVRHRDAGDAGPVWTVNSLDPLDLDPSLHCDRALGGCGAHGHIHGGCWVPV